MLQHRFYINHLKSILLTVVLLHYSGFLYADGVVIELTPQLKNALKPLGEGVIGKALPAVAIDKPHHYLSSVPGSYLFQVISEKNNGETFLTETHKAFSENKGNRQWSRKIDEYLTEDWIEGKNGSIHLTGETNTELGYRVVLKSHLILQPETSPGQRWEVDSALEAYEIKSPKKVAYTGRLKATRTYEGLYEIKTPAGVFSAILLSEEYKIKIGAVNITDQRYTFYAPNIGKVAEVDGLHASAFLVVHIRKKEAKILIRYPGMETE